RGRGRLDQGRRAAPDPDRAHDEQLLGDLSGRLSAEGEARGVRARALRRGRGAHRHRGREAPGADLPARDLDQGLAMAVSRKARAIPTQTTRPPSTQTQFEDRTTPAYCASSPTPGRGGARPACRPEAGYPAGRCGDDPVTK